MSRSTRKPYRKSRRFDKSCRCHGGCPWCENNRMHSTKLGIEKTKEQLSESKRTDATRAEATGSHLIGAKRN